MATSDQEFWRLVATARNPERLFPVRSNKFCAFYAGHLPDAMQVLIGRTAAEKILVLSFGRWGVLYNVHRRALPPFRQPPEAPHLEVNDVEFHDYLRKELGFTPGLVRVQQFRVSDDDCGFWVGPFPWHFDRFLARPEEYGPEDIEEQAQYRERIREFIARGVCVLDWGNDWWVLEADGVEAGWNLPAGGAE
jgi:hypothetical protein